MGKRRGTLDEMSDAAVQCHFGGHNWVWATDANFVYEGGQIVQITQISRCDRGCECLKKDWLSVPDFEPLSRSRIIYPSHVPYLASVSYDRHEYRREFYARKGFDRRKGFVRR